MSILYNSVNKLNIVKGLKKDLKNLKRYFLILNRNKNIKDYIVNHTITKLHLGSNLTLLDNWLCSDLVPMNNMSVFLDVTQKFPFKDNSFDYVYSEHLIEHLTQEEGLFMMKECHRILKNKGRIRIATPDMEVILRLYTEKKINYGKDYKKWSMDNFTKNLTGYSPVVVVNTLFHNWGHRFLYDFDFLKDTLLQCGYTDVERFNVSQSNDVHLQDIERHHENVGNHEMIKFETLIVEAVKN